jgi:hypothetical protein
MPHKCWNWVATGRHASKEATLHKRHYLSCSATALAICAALVFAEPVQWALAAQPFVQKNRAGKKAPVAEKRDRQQRPAFSAQDEDAAVVLGLADARVWGDSEADFVRLLPQAQGPWLAISGGGADGAYGGGVLAGWTQSGMRPEFAVVTGSSIGALIAPFAFLGAAYDEEIRKNFTGMTAADIFEDRMTDDSLFDQWPLKRQLEQRVTSNLLAAIAAEHARGRRLFVATTNLDAGRRVIWNMGAIAAHGDEKSLKLFRDVLLASCSIPGFFSPVSIEVEANGKRFQEAHGDGTLTAPFFVLPETMLSASDPSRQPVRQLYVIINSKLGSEFKMAERNIPGVLGRSIGVALTQALRAQIALLYAGAQRQGIGLRVAHVDEAFDHPSRGPFDGKYMQALYEFGVAAGKKGTAFEDTLPDRSLHGSNAQ